MIRLRIEHGEAGCVFFFAETIAGLSPRVTSVETLQSARVGGAKAVSAARIQVQVRLDNGCASRAEVVILMQGEGERFHIAYRRDDSDGPT